MTAREKRDSAVTLVILAAALCAAFGPLAVSHILLWLAATGGILSWVIDWRDDRRFEVAGRARIAHFKEHGKFPGDDDESTP